MEKIVILGAGGFGREVLDILVAQNKISKRWDILGFIDENDEMKGKFLNGYPVLGSFDWFTESSNREINAACAIGSTVAKKKVVGKGKRLGLNFPNIIHPNAVMTEFVTLGEGIIICAGCILTNLITIGNYVILNLDVTVGHDCAIEDYCTLNPGVHISGNNRICEGVYLGTGAVTIQGMTIGAWSTVGAGAVVVRDLPEDVVAVGVPAKPIKQTQTQRSDFPSAG